MPCSSYILFNLFNATDLCFVYVLKIEYGWILWLTVSLFVYTYITKKFTEIPPCSKEFIFITVFTIVWINPTFNEVKNIFRKRLISWQLFVLSLRERPLMTSLIFWIFLTYLPTYLCPNMSLLQKAAYLMMSFFVWPTLTIFFHAATQITRICV